MEKPLTLGIIGLDTSHVEVFARLLNDPNDPDHLPGARITVGYPGGSPDFEKSASRVAGFTARLAEVHGVRMLASPEAVAEASDAILLTTVDGRLHPDQFSRIARFQKPTFVDKPFAVSSAGAASIAAMASEHGIPVMSASALRFAEALRHALAEIGDSLVGADFVGPMPIEPTQGTFFWYGVHLAEALYEVMGTGCREVRVTTSESHDVVAGLWADGRIGCIRGFRGDRYYFRGCLHHGAGTVWMDLDGGRKAKHVHLLAAILEFFRTGVSAIPIENTVEVVRFLEAADESRVTGRRVVL